MAEAEAAGVEVPAGTFSTGIDPAIVAEQASTWVVLRWMLGWAGQVKCHHCHVYCLLAAVHDVGSPACWTSNNGAVDGRRNSLQPQWLCFCSNFQVGRVRPRGRGAVQQLAVPPWWRQQHERDSLELRLAVSDEREPARRRPRLSHRRLFVCRRHRNRDTRWTNK